MRRRHQVLAAVFALGVALLASACSSASGSTHAAAGVVVAVGAENEYANVIGQVGGKYVQASAIMSNPNTDPHTFEANAAAFIASLTAWNNAIAAFAASYPNTPVAATEPVADYLLQAAGADNLT